MNGAPAGGSQPSESIEMQFDGSELVDPRARIRKRRYPLRWLAVVIVLGVAYVVVADVVTNERFQWDVFAHYIFDHSVLAGVRVTLIVTAGAYAAGCAAGIVIAVSRLSSNPIISSFAVIYVWIFRGTPVLVQLFLWYNVAALYPRIRLQIPFGGPLLIDLDANTVVTPAVAGMCGLIFHLGASLGEAIRGGILSVSEGQTEAAVSIGMSRGQMMRRIILPQAVRSIIPAAGNELIALLKYSSLLSVIAVTDLLYSVKIIYTNNYKVVPLLLVAAVWYLVIVSILSYGQSHLERYFARGSSRLRSDRRLPRLSARSLGSRKLTATTESND